MKVTLELNDGRKITFEDVKNISIIEEHLPRQKAQTKKETTEFAPIPMEGRWFKVEPLTIDQNLFKEKRKNPSQERTRQLILEAFEALREKPQYAISFKTMMTPKKWASRRVKELKEMSCKLGDHMADRVEQALEWAQRISNGESWEDICNKPDTANWYRVVIWDKDGHTCLVGGSREFRDNRPATDVCFHETYCDIDDISKSVPVVVSYDV